MSSLLTTVPPAGCDKISGKISQPLQGLGVVASGSEADVVAISAFDRGLNYHLSYLSPFNISSLMDKMTSRYVPPALRQKVDQNGKSPLDTDKIKPRRSDMTEDDGLHTVFEVQRYFWPVEDDENDPSQKEHSTLNASAETPDQLSHVILFAGANPRWAIDKIIFVKSNVELVEPYSKVNEKKPDSGNIPDKPIAVFEQRPGPGGQHGRTIKFTGWFRIENVDILKPNSPELVRMLEQKWRSAKPDRSGNYKYRQRDASAWQASLSHTWAVLKLAWDETDCTNDPPEVCRLPDRIQQSYSSMRTRDNRSVNERLAELRLGKSENSPPKQDNTVDGHSSAASDPDKVTERTYGIDSTEAVEQPNPV